MRKSPAFILFFKKKRTMFKFEKHQSTILGPSSSDSLTYIEKKFGKTFSWVCMVCFKKPAKNSQSKQDNLYQNFGHFNKKKNTFSVFKQNLIIQYNHIKYGTSF